MFRAILATVVTLTATLEIQGELLVQTGAGVQGQRASQEDAMSCSIEEIEAAALVLFFPPLVPPGNPPDDPPDPPVDPPPPPDPQVDPPDPEDPPEEPPHHHPEPLSLAAGLVGGGLVCVYGWWRRRR
jgi:hypothetical protein